jgi:enamine deaminase RidA (YjgF/YER057c/UK114 family)
MRLARTVPLLAALALPAQAQQVTRHPIPSSDFPIAAAVEVPAGVTMVHLSGAVPPRREGGPGDTETQTRGVLNAIAASLRRLDLTMGDVVRMQVFLVGDATRGGRMDFDGFMRAYREFFGSPQQPNLPVRSVIQVAGLANPDWLVEIEVSAARPRR